MAEAKTGHEALIVAAKEEQDRIKQEIEALSTNHQEEKDALKLQHEKLIEEMKESEKVSNDIFWLEISCLMRLSRFVSRRNTS